MEVFIMSRFKTYTDYHEGQDHLTTRKGFEHEGHWITNCFTDETGRFEVDPEKYYGLTEKQVHELDEFNYYSDPDYYGFREMR